MFRTPTFALACTALCLYAGLFILGADAKAASIAVVFALIIVELYRRPRALAVPLALACCFAVFITTMNHYVYAGQNFFLGTMNLFPLVMWTAGLLLVREAYLRIEVRVRYPLFTTLVLYWVILFILEYVFYYHLGVQTTAGNPSFLGTGVLHGTPLMHIFYPSAGPVFLIFLHFLERARMVYAAPRIG